MRDGFSARRGLRFGIVGTCLRDVLTVGSEWIACTRFLLWKIGWILASINLGLEMRSKNSLKVAGTAIRSGSTRMRCDEGDVELLAYCPVLLSTTDATLIPSGCLSSTSGSGHTEGRRVTCERCL